MQQPWNLGDRPGSDGDRFHSALVEIKSGSLLRSVGEDSSAIALRRLVASEIKARADRKQYLEGSLFSDPAWDILLELFAAELDGERLSVSGVAVTAAVPQTTAIRWLNALQDHGLLRRQSDAGDARRSFLILSEKGSEAMRRYFGRLSKAA